MPHIFDNIETPLLPALQKSISGSKRADFCVGYFNLRGWRQIAPSIDKLSGEELDREGQTYCRLLIGMQALPEQELRQAFALSDTQEMDNAGATALKKRLVADFARQLTIGAPNNQDEVGLKQLKEQLKSGRLRVKLYVRHLLHAKLYLLHREDSTAPIVGYLGSSNLTFAGLAWQGELNVDIADEDAGRKLERWFNARWEDKYAFDITDELAAIIEESWAGEQLISPYHIYLKMAYHLSQEARAGLDEYKIPREFEKLMFDYQKAAVKIAAHHINRRDGVLLADVVGLGKTLMATALARIYQDDFGMNTLIICPPNLEPMWELYKNKYNLIAHIVTLGQVIDKLPELMRYRMVLIDESHNLRNREGKRYRAIYDYIGRNGSKCILLTATPYNKDYLDLGSQLRLFVRNREGNGQEDVDVDIGIRPERLLSEVGEAQFNSKYQCHARSLAAFERSKHVEDWRELMRLYMIRRTRSFVQTNYAKEDSVGRKYLQMANGERSYFPTRVVRSIKFSVNDDDPSDQYARLYSTTMVEIINNLLLPRYGLANYVNPDTAKKASAEEKKQVANLTRAGQRLKGFSRTNLFKRLESSGNAFIQSVQRHILRNYIFLYALENNLAVPIGTQGIELLQLNNGNAELLELHSDEDTDPMEESGEDEQTNDNLLDDGLAAAGYYVNSIQPQLSEAVYFDQAAKVYEQYKSVRLRKRFKWLGASLFYSSLKDALLQDANELLAILKEIGPWKAHQDNKLETLYNRLNQLSPREKAIVFTQFADTAEYLAEQLEKRGLPRISYVTGKSSDPSAIARRFSPRSNNVRDKVSAEEELDILIATDVLSEGQNLQDCAIVINYDLPWAIIRLIQRAGRIDRIGQVAERIFCDTFLPAEGVERIIQLRQTLSSRLSQNAAVVGTDEKFFAEDESWDIQIVYDLYNEKAGILDENDEGEVDLASYAYQIWNNATKNNSMLEAQVKQLPNVAFATRQYSGTNMEPEGVLIYSQTGQGNDALAWVGKDGRSVTQSQLAILRAAECTPMAKPMPHHPAHHSLVQEGIRLIAQETGGAGGQLGGGGSIRHRVYERLKEYATKASSRVQYGDELGLAIDAVFRKQLRPSASETLNRQWHIGIDNDELAELVITLYQQGNLSSEVGQAQERTDPQIICSLGLFDHTQ